MTEFSVGSSNMPLILRKRICKAYKLICPEKKWRKLLYKKEETARRNTNCTNKTHPLWFITRIIFIVNIYQLQFLQCYHNVSPSYISLDAWNFTLDHAELNVHVVSFVTELWYAHTNDASKQKRPTSGLFLIAVPNWGRSVNLPTCQEKCFSSHQIKLVTWKTVRLPINRQIQMFTVFPLQNSLDARRQNLTLNK